MLRFAPDFGPKLLSALGDAERGGRDELLPVLEPDTADEARAIIAAFDQNLAAGCPKDEVARMFTRLSVLFPQSAHAKQSDDEAAVTLATYVDLLCDIPGDVLAPAFKAVAQRCKFFPTVAEIREAAAPELNNRRWRLMTLRRLLVKHEREWEPPLAPEDQCSPEDAKRILAEVAAARAVSKPSDEKEERRARQKARVDEVDRVDRDRA